MNQMPREQITWQTMSSTSPKSFMKAVAQRLELVEKNKFKAKHKPWFTPNLESLRKRVRRSANFFGRNPNSHHARDEYNLARRQYNRLLIKYCKFELDKLLNSVDRQEMWSLLSKMKPKKSSTPIDMDELHSHFEELLNTPQKHILH